MRMFYPVLSFAVLSALPLLSHAALQCNVGTPVNVSGRATMINTSATRQAGQVCMTLTNASGIEVFDQCGAILGNVLSSNPETGISILNHTALFSKRQAFATRNDVAQVTGVLATEATGVPCAFSVVEKITQIVWSKGILQSGAADVTAVGSLSACTDKNLNTYTLSGTACYKDSE